MSYTGKIAWETLRSLDSSTLSGSYAEIGSALLNQSYKLKIINNSTVLVTISIDGATDIDVLPASSYFLYDEGLGNQVNLLSLPAGTQFYAKGSAGTGLIYLVTQYIVKE